MSSTLTSTISTYSFSSSPTQPRGQKRASFCSQEAPKDATHRTLGHNLGQPRPYSNFNMSSSFMYQGHRAVAHDNRIPTREQNLLAQMERSRIHAQEVRNATNNVESYRAQNQYQQYQSQAASSQIRQAANMVNCPTARQSSTRPSTPNSTHSSHAALAATNSVKGDAQSMVLHSLQVPARISLKGGNLADFAAQVTCLFWFESLQVLEIAENIRSTPKENPLPHLAPAAYPTEAFRKWVQTVLSTTQVTQNVILLAVMFVYRLKMTNPSVRGRPGSEYRLLTVALMLGNKFLDDNTYTNKTWAEVSGISVQEIHVMEVEFLSNMRYALLASKEEWEAWLDKLSAYFEFWERAVMSASPQPIPSPTLFIPSPTVGKSYSPLSSPTSAFPAALHRLSMSSRSATKYSPPPTSSLPSSHIANNHSLFTFPTGGSNVSPLSIRPDLGNTRKRSWEGHTADLPSTKRQVAGASLSTATSKPPTTDPRRLPVPNLSLNVAHNTPAVKPSQYSSTTYPVPQAVPLSLPPLEPGLRAMSTVYAPAAMSYWTPDSNGSSQPGVPAVTKLATPSAHYRPASNSGYGTPTKQRLSPINTLTPSATYNTSSPLHEQYSHHNGFTTPVSHSPSVYLQHRASPYRPIRNVHTLLNPPPSNSLHVYHLPAIAPSQMHYQPIGRRDDFRTGVVPEYRNQALYGSSSIRNPAHNASSAEPNSQQRYPNLVN